MFTRVLWFFRRFLSSSVWILRVSAVGIVFSASFLFFHSTVAWAEIASLQVVERPESEYLILELSINGVSREQGIDAYLPEQEAPDSVLIPFTAFAKAMSYSIKVNPVDGIGEGWFQSEDNVFQLDIKRGEVRYGQNTDPLPAKGVEVHIDDIYVSAGLLEQWFGLTIELVMSELVLKIGTAELLPFQAASARLNRADLLKPQKPAEPQIDPADAYFPEYEMFTWPSIMLQTNLAYSDSDTGSLGTLISSEQANMDLLGFGADINISRRIDSEGESTVESAIATLQKRDPKRKLLGPLNAGKITIGDVNFTSAPLFGGGGMGAGVAVSSDPEVGFRYARDESTFVVDGDAPANWDAELYRNGHFVAFMSTGAAGRFEFENLDLIDGYNRFEVVLYGPEGQKRTITREVFRGASMLKPDETTYDFAIGSPNADFLPFTSDPRNDYSPGVSAQVFHGVNNFITVGGSAYSGKSADGEQQHAATATAIAAVRGVALQGQAMAANEGRKAYQATAQARPLDFNTSVSHTIYEGFSEDDQDIKDSTSLTVSRQFSGFDVQFGAEKNNLLDGATETVFENIVSTTVFGTKITNELVHTSRSTDDTANIDGNFNAATDILDVRLRGDLSYTLSNDAEDRLRRFTIHAQKNFENDNSLRLNVDYDFATSLTSLDARYAHKFGVWSIDFTANVNSESDFGAGITVRSGLQPDPKSWYKQVDAVTASQASMGVRAFVDANDNNQYDDGEKLIENVSFRTNRGDTIAATDIEGEGWITGLQETPTKISVDRESIPSIYLVPAKDSAHVLPRRGARATIDFAFKQMGEIDGFIRPIDDPDNADAFIAHVPVRLINAKTNELVEETKSESDGYYIFTSIPLGSYRIESTQGWFEGEDAVVARKDVTITQDAPTALDINLAVDLPPASDLEDIAGIDGIQLPPECAGSDDACLAMLEKIWASQQKG